MASPGLYCTHCGTLNDAQAAYCLKCGAPQPGAPAFAAVAAGGATAVPVPAAAYPPVPRAIGYGGFWIRFVAIIIDAIIVGIAMAPIKFAIVGPMFMNGDFPYRSGHFGWVFPAFIAKVAIIERVGWWLYDALLTCSNKQGTVGKMIFGLKVTDMQGQRISFMHATGRHFAKYISFLVACIGFIMAGFTARKQALHDLIAGTVVIRTTD